MVLKAKPKKKPLSFEHYARAIQTDIADLGKEMRDGFKSMHSDIATGFENVRKQTHDIREDVKRLNEIMVSKADLSEAIRRELDISPYAKEADVKEIRERLFRVEEKLGLKPSRRAA